MQKNGVAILILVVLASLPGTVLAEIVQGRLDRVSFAEGVVEVNGVKYEVNAEATRVTLGGSTKLGEEDLRRGDEVQLFLQDAAKPGEKPELKAIVILRGSKSGLDS